MWRPRFCRLIAAVFSKHQFTQPQLLAVLCLMRYEDWTFRETEVRLREHRELRETLKLSSVPDYTTLYRFLQRLDDKTIDRVLGEAARRFKSPQRRARRRASRRLAWCWPTPNLTPNKTIDTFANGLERTASSWPSEVAAVAWIFADRCGDIFRKRPTGNEPRWKRSSPSLNANCRLAPRGVACRCKSAKRPCLD
jgi:transposase-like protein DUF772